MNAGSQLVSLSLPGDFDYCTSATYFFVPSAYRFSAFGEKTSSAIALSITAAASLLAVDPSQGPKAPQLLYSISSLVPRISPEGGSVMDDRPSVSSPTSQYDDFL
ncbi:MAG: hypothetical protein WBM51_19665, partial [Pseudolabrys sp.]